MLRKMFNKWVAYRAFNALYMYHTTMTDRSNEVSNKVIEVLDIIRGDLK